MDPYVRDYQHAVSRIKELACFAEVDDPLRHAPESESEMTLFSIFMRIVADLEMEEEEARRHYHAIRAHAEHLKKCAGRRVGFHVAMCDYLINITHLFKCPKFMEFGTYETLVRHTTTDDLTGLYNRRFFNEQLERELFRARRYGHPFSILMIDIDDFKTINDRYGHPVGDKVLQDLAGIMRSYLRTEDIAARYGGEEFIVLLSHTELEGARLFGERMLKTTAMHNFPEGLQLSFSGGIAGYPHHGADVQGLLNTADRSLYDAKLRGKACISCSFDERRGASRYKTGIGFQMFKHSGQPLDGELRDISITGLRGNAQVLLQSGDEITIRLRDTKERMTYMVEARVVWAEREEENGAVMFGAKYTERNPNLVSHLISDYMRHT